MFLLSPAEQQALLATSPAAPAPATADHHARPKRKRTGFHHRRKPSQAAMGRSAAQALIESHR
jgi:hypothetical protein